MLEIFSAARRFVALGCLAVACGGNGTDEPPPTLDPGPSTGSVCPANSTLTHENFGMAFFEMYCTKCHSENPPDGSRHGAPRGLNWDDLETVRAYASQIDTMAAAGPDAINSGMPPSRELQPSDDERRMLGEWLACGAP